MTKWLASVQSVTEAQALINNLPDILDIKNPAQGALGALPVEQVKEIVNLAKGQCLTSATVGDLVMDAEIISHALISMAASGVDYLKVGLFPDDDLANCLLALNMTISQLAVPVIAVIFADKMPSPNDLTLIKQAGFAGVMIDTAEKNGKHLLQHWTKDQLTEFVRTARSHNLLCGLAGSLRYEDIADLKAFQADYLGFRSALCRHSQRREAIDVALVERVRTAIKTAA